jgi:hypothetical protein
VLGEPFILFLPDSLLPVLLLSLESTVSILGKHPYRSLLPCPLRLIFHLQFSSISTSLPSTLQYHVLRRRFRLKPLCRRCDSTDLELAGELRDLQEAFVLHFLTHC